MRRVGQVVVVCLVVLVGCATTGERVDVVIPAASTGADVGTAGSGSGLRAVGKPFEDARMDRTHLGSRSHFWGNTRYFDLPKRTGGESTIQERLLGSGTDQVFWFDPEDAQQLVNEVLEKNLEKFVADTRVDGK